jgi:hypothetical protein
MRLHPTAIGLAVRHDQPDAYLRRSSRSPAQARGHPRRQAALPIQSPEKLVDIRDLGLELDHEQQVAGWVIRKEVDDTALAAEGERRLGRAEPGTDLTEPARDEFVQARVARVEQSVEVSGSPPRDQVKSDVQDRSDATEGREAGLAEVAALNPRDGRPRNAGNSRNVGLSQTTAKSDLPQHRPDPLVVHRPSLTFGRSLRLIRRQGLAHVFYSSSTRPSTGTNPLSTAAAPATHT